MSFSDIFKSSFLDKIESFSALDTVIVLGLAFVLGLFICLIYKKTFNGVMYSSSFGLSLIAMSTITSMIILAVTSNVVLSLGMVGALSIVRFRTAIKEPMDIAFLFWAISIGIVLGAGMIPLAVFGSVFIGIILLVFANRNSFENPYILIFTASDDYAEKKAREFVAANVKKMLLKSKTVTASGIELTVEVRLKDASSDFVNLLAEQAGVSNPVLVSYNGEYMA